MKTCGLLLLLLASSTLGNTAPIPNGSFEEGTFLPTIGLNMGRGGMSLPAGSTAISGWTVLRGEIAWLSSGYEELTAPDGDLFLDLTGYHDTVAFGGIALQTSILTTAGQHYRLGFQLGSDTRWNTIAPSVLLTVGSLSANFTATLSGRNHWDPFYFDFTGTGSPIEISITGEPPPNATHYLGLDNLTLTAIPEPSTLAVQLLLPFCAFAVRKWRQDAVRQN